MKRLFAVLLCLCLLLGLFAGCTENPPAPSETAPSETPPVTAPPETQPKEEPAALYRAAADRLAGAQSFTTELSITTERTIGEDTLTETTKRSAKYQNYGAKDMIANVSDEIIFGTGLTRAAYDLIWSDGTVYARLKASKFVSRTTAEDFLAEQLPPVLLDAANYGSVTSEQTAEGTVFTFAEPTAAEGWAVPEDGSLVSASGSVTVNAAGELVKQSYEVTFLYGVTEIRQTYDMTVELPQALDLSDSVPENAKGYESLDSITAAIMLMRAYIALQDADTFSIQTYNQVMSQAALVIRVANEDLHAIGGDSDLIMREKDRVNIVDYGSDETYSDTLEELYLDGELTTTHNDEDSETQTVRGRDVEDYCRQSKMQYVPSFDQLVDAKITDVGSYYLIEFSASDEFGNKLNSLVCLDLFADSAALNDIASSYTNKTVEGFMGVEKYTWLPTSLNVNFEGIHTIKDDPCLLQMKLNQSISLYDPDTYNEIKDEPLPDEEPEQKPTPVFYEVRDNATGSKMYLFGTIHVGDDRTGFLPQVIQTAFDEADALAVEFDSERFLALAEEDEELQQQIARSYYYTDGTELSNHLDSDLYKAALACMKVAGQYNATADRLKAFVWSSIIENFYLSQGRRLTSAKGVDNRLLRLAREQEKEILDVESGLSQLEMLSGYSDDVQQMLLASTISASRNENLQHTYELYDRWCEGDEAKLIEILKQMSEDERAEIDEDELAIYDEYHRKMEQDRNAAMVEVAKEYLAGEKTVFYAVGLAHLLGEGGLVQSLRDAGCTVTLIDTKQ